MKCFVAIDALLRERVTPELYWPTLGTRIDKRLQILTRPSKIYKENLTLEKAVEMFVEKFDGITVHFYILGSKVHDLVSMMQQQDYWLNDVFVEIKVFLLFDILSRENLPCR